MTLRIGERAPDFIAESTFGELCFHTWAADSWVLFFSHPGDFTPVCTTELGRTAQLANHFERRGVKLLGLSTDSLEDHRAWVKDIDRIHKTKLAFPVIADPLLRIARLYGMIHPNESDHYAVRSVFIIDPALCIRLTISYPMSVGRNFNELLRAIDALQCADKHSVNTPADWRVGDPVIIPTTISDTDARQLFPQGWEEVRPYLRITVCKDKAA